MFYLLTIIILFSINVYAEDEIPTTKQIIEWGKNCPDEHLEQVKKKYGGMDIEQFKNYSISGEIYNVGLLTKEKAYLAEAYLNKAGRNFFVQKILIRPDIEAACIIGPPVTHSLEIIDLDLNGISEIVTHSSASGGGQNLEKKV